MPKCRCKPDCKLEIEIGTPIVYVSFFQMPKPTATVALEHLRQTEIPAVVSLVDENPKRNGQVG